MDYSKYTNYDRFYEMKHLVPKRMEAYGDDTVPGDDWSKARGFVSGFNCSCYELLYSSVIFALDKSMSSFWPR